MKNQIHAIVCVFCALALTGAAHAVSVFSYSFDGTETISLNGQSVGGSSVTWVANDYFKAGGSVAGAGSAWLAHTFTSGNIYTLSASVDASAAAGNIFGAISFTNDDFSAKYTGNLNGDTHNYASWALRKNGSETQRGTTLFPGPGITNAANNRTITQSAGVLKLVLDTTESIWRYDAYLDGVKLTSKSYNSTTNGNFTGVGLFSSGANVKFDNFEFSYVAAVPEPSTTAVILGLLATLAFAVKRRCRVK